MIAPALDRGRSELLSLTFLLTGDADAAVSAVAETEQFASADVRAAAISGALRHIRPRLTAPPAPPLSPLKSLPAIRRVTRDQLQNALFAMDLFSRCLLILALYEKMPLPEVAALLGVETETVVTALAESVRMLNRTIAAEQGWQA